MANAIAARLLVAAAHWGSRSIASLPQPLLAAITQPARQYATGRASSVASAAPQQQERENADSQDFEVELPAFQTYKCDPPPDKIATNVPELLGLYEKMQTMRRMEIAADMAYKNRLIRGFCHLADGQEAVKAGMAAAMSPSDSIIQSYRDHCEHIAHGGSVEEVMGELMGRASGATQGKGGSMHLYAPQRNWWGGWGIVGSQVPLGTGLALGHKMRRDGGVCFALYGDGAANQGQVFEAFNMAALWELPVVYACENNRFAMGTTQAHSSKAAHLYMRGNYIPGIWVEGMDVLAVKAACQYAKQYARTRGPIILELDTYRYHGHSMSDPGSTYRTRDEIMGVRRQRDPLQRVRQVLEAHGVDAAQFKQLDRKAKQVVDLAVERVQREAEPPAEELFRDVYSQPDGARLRNVSGEYVRRTLRGGQQTGV